MAWRLAKSLVVLRDQINGVYPNRSKKSDGTIGDAAHAGTASDHNPNSAGVVCALDLTDDPANGFDVHGLAERLRLNPHPNLKYIVSKGRIASRKYGWVWRKSSGHYAHAHFSVGVGSDGKSIPGTYDDQTLWNIGEKMSTDALTSDEFNYLHILAYGGLPGPGYDGRYTGQPLTPTLHTVWGPDPLLEKSNTLASKVKAKKLIKPSDCLSVPGFPSDPVKCDCDVDAIAEAVADRLAERLKE